MKRYFWERSGYVCLIFDRQRSAVQPIAWCEEDDIADLICAALNGDA